MRASLALGIIGGIFGILGGLFVVGFGTTFDSGGTTASQGWIALAASVVAIFASTQTKENSKRWGWVLIVSGIVGLIAISFFYVLPAILLIIGGISALKASKKNKREPAESKVKLES